MKPSPGRVLRATVLIAQTLLIVVYAAFFSMVPAVLDNPEKHRGNAIFLIPMIALVVSVLGFFFPRLSAILMISHPGPTGIARRGPHLGSHDCCRARQYLFTIRKCSGR